MKKRNDRSDELRPEYDLRQLLKGGVRGKYAERYHVGTNLILPDRHPEGLPQSLAEKERPL